jgi:hypothetical protein
VRRVRSAPHAGSRCSPRRGQVVEQPPAGERLGQAGSMRVPRSSRGQDSVRVVLACVLGVAVVISTVVLVRRIPPIGTCRPDRRRRCPPAPRPATRQAGPYRCPPGRHRRPHHRCPRRGDGSRSCCDPPAPTGCRCPAAHSGTCGLLQNLVAASSPLSAGSRAFARWGLLRHVEADQRWGVPVVADPGSTVAVKNGCLAVDDDESLGSWAVNSAGQQRRHRDGRWPPVVDRGDEPAQFRFRERHRSRRAVAPRGRLRSSHLSATVRS